MEAAGATALGSGARLPAALDHRDGLDLDEAAQALLYDRVPGGPAVLVREHLQPGRVDVRPNGVVLDEHRDVGDVAGRRAGTLQDPAQDLEDVGRLRLG